MRDYPCAVDYEFCANKQNPGGYGGPVCHGSYRPECYVNWASTDPEDTEPYEDYLADLGKNG
jgi:hypothetical protein